MRNAKAEGRIVHETQDGWAYDSAPNIRDIVRRAAEIMRQECDTTRGRAKTVITLLERIDTEWPTFPSQNLGRVNIERLLTEMEDAMHLHLNQPARGDWMAMRHHWRSLVETELLSEGSGNG